MSERAGLVAARSGLRQRQEADAWKRAAAGLPPSEGLERAVSALSCEIRAVELRARGFAKDAQDLLRSIPGIGPACASALVAVVGDADRFPDPKRLVAYIGLDCRVHESGSSIKGKGFITKRGDKRLRHLLYMAAFVGLRGIPEHRAFYEKKRSEGHHHVSALCAVERKLVHLIWAVWTRGTPFEQRKTPVV